MLRLSKKHFPKHLQEFPLQVADASQIEFRQDNQQQARQGLNGGSLIEEIPKIVQHWFCHEDRSDYAGVAEP